MHGTSVLLERYWHWVTGFLRYLPVMGRIGIEWFFYLDRQQLTCEAVKLSIPLNWSSILLATCDLTVSTKICAVLHCTLVSVLIAVQAYITEYWFSGGLFGIVLTVHNCSPSLICKMQPFHTPVIRFWRLHVLLNQGWSCSRDFMSR